MAHGRAMGFVYVTASPEVLLISPLWKWKHFPNQADEFTSGQALINVQVVVYMCIIKTASLSWEDPPRDIHCGWVCWNPGVCMSWSECICIHTYIYPECIWSLWIQAFCPLGLNSDLPLSGDIVWSEFCNYFWTAICFVKSRDNGSTSWDDYGN